VKQPELPAPVAKARPSSRQFSGVTVDDPYAWLEDASDPAVIAHLEAENAYTDAVMSDMAAERESIYQEIVGRVQRTDTHVPFRMGNVFYYIRTEDGKDYDILCRKRAAWQRQRMSCSISTPSPVTTSVSATSPRATIIATWPTP
jgi:oligopeptidase B